MNSAPQPFNPNKSEQHHQKKSMGNGSDYFLPVERQKKKKRICSFVSQL
jgi:hypothetical protein